MNEVLSDKLTSNEYRVSGKRINLPNKIVIPIDTAGGINCGGMPPIRPGDVVNVTHSIGATGAIMQSLLRLDFWHPEAYEQFRSKWTSLNPDFTITAGNHPRVECSRDVVDAIELAGSRIVKGAYQKGGNLTKDSLYAERGTDIFLHLCQTENCRTTEMELSAIAVAAHAHQTMSAREIVALRGEPWAPPSTTFLLSISLRISSPRKMPGFLVCQRVHHKRPRSGSPSVGP